uniref:MalT-like TPR region domain-containing protein n=1 Tax=Chaetoceros debilis TaxID=122233 RepID=A0A7S3V7N0_9STRA|mmetsp:Transcript_6278/g.9198  ORF Transcript_6278/g.9198 Transcript_6278/m.9198 type:complete len:293 (+) Transcript_6278:142-1020(+)
MSLQSITGEKTDISSFYVSNSIVENALNSYYEGQGEKALKLLATALKTQRLTLGDADICVAHTLGNIGAVYVSMGWYEEAIEVLEESLAINTKLRNDPSIKLPKGCEQINLYENLNNLGSASFLAGDYLNAMSYYQECLKDLTGGEIPGTASEIANTLFNIGNCHAVHENELDDALVAMVESLELIQANFGPEDTRCAETLERIGAIYMKKNQLEEAMNAFVEVLRITKMTLGSEHVDCAPSLYNVGLIYERKRENRRAMDSFKAAMEIYESNGVKDESIDRVRQHMMHLKI